MAKNKYRFHILGLAHTQTTKEWNACAYTQKIYRLCQMLTSLGHEVYHYGAEGSNPPCAEHITVVTKEDQRRAYGDYDWKSDFFKHAPNDYAYQTFNIKALWAIQAGIKRGDFLLSTFGSDYQQWLCDLIERTGKVIVCESGVGYRGVFAKYKVFESYSQMHFVYGWKGDPAKKGDIDGSNYDCVIPNYYDVSEFEFKEKKQDYFLYLGRLIGRKGITIAAQTVDAIGGKLIAAGQGKLVNPGECDIRSKNVRHIGYVGVEKRRELLSGAKALFVPTIYIEPFGGVAVEAALSGTPVITSDWGAFTETVIHGVTGYRCRTFEQYQWAAKNIHKIKPVNCRAWGLNYDMERVKWMYQEYFYQLHQLWDNGWYQPNPSRTELDWLTKRYNISANGVGDDVGQAAPP